MPHELADERRRSAILDEILQSRADVLVLLGDKPIQWFLTYFDNRWRRLSDFLRNEQPYGAIHVAQIGNAPMKVLPLAHPRQIAQLGPSSVKWYDLHAAWIRERASRAL